MVYITPDLFGPTSTHNRADTTPLSHWNAMVDPQHASGLGKRRRQDREEDSTMYEKLPTLCNPNAAKY